MALLKGVSGSLL